MTIFGLSHKMSHTTEYGTEDTSYTRLQIHQQPVINMSIHTHQSIQMGIAPDSLPARASEGLQAPGWKWTLRTLGVSSSNSRILGASWATAMWLLWVSVVCYVWHSAGSRIAGDSKLPILTLHSATWHSIKDIKNKTKNK